MKTLRGDAIDKATRFVKIFLAVDELVHFVKLAEGELYVLKRTGDPKAQELYEAYAGVLSDLGGRAEEWWRGFVSRFGSQLMEDLEDLTPEEERDIKAFALYEVSEKAIEFLQDIVRHIWAFDEGPVGSELLAYRTCVKDLQKEVEDLRSRLARLLGKGEW